MLTGAHTLPVKPAGASVGWKNPIYPYFLSFPACAKRDRQQARFPISLSVDDEKPVPKWNWFLSIIQILEQLHLHIFLK